MPDKPYSAQEPIRIGTAFKGHQDLRRDAGAQQRKIAAGPSEVQDGREARVRTNDDELGKCCWGRIPKRIWKTVTEISSKSKTGWRAARQDYRQDLRKRLALRFTANTVWSHSFKRSKLTKYMTSEQSGGRHSVRPFLSFNSYHDISCCD